MSVEEKRYNLQQLKSSLLELNLSSNDNLVLNEFMFRNVYGVFGDDNSFVFAIEKCFLGFNYSLSILEFYRYVLRIIFGGDSLISRKYYLIDYYCRSIIGGIEDEKYADGDLYNFNGINYFVVLLTKIIPASYLKNISLDNIGIIQDRINMFLMENPKFVEQIFFSNVDESEDYEDEMEYAAGDEKNCKKKLLEV